MSRTRAQVGAPRQFDKAHDVEVEPGSNSEEPAAREYREVIQRAVQEYQSGHWAEAWAYFSRAHELHPSARTLRSLGLVAYEQRRYVVALDYFSRALQSQVFPLTEEMRVELERATRDARSFVSFLSIEARPDPIRLLVDGEPARFASDRSLMLDAGVHELVISAPGHITQTRMLTANGAEHRTLSLMLQPEAPPLEARTAPPAPAVFEPAPAPSAPSAQAGPGFLATRSVPQLIGLSLGAGAVLAAAVGGTYSLLALKENSASSKDCPMNQCEGAGLTHRNAALFRADVATTAFVAAGVLGAAGLLTYLLAPSERRVLSGKPSVRVRPSAAVSRNTIQLGISGRF